MELLQQILLLFGMGLLGWCIPNWLVLLNPKCSGGEFLSELSFVTFILISQYFIF